nr:PEP-CTERM sorting domain-containing protein [Armatimonas sp.]
MKTTRNSFISALALLTLATLPQRASAQANLTFSGGSGTPLTMTLTAPVSYTMTASAAFNTAPVFVFKGVGNVVPGNGVTGTMRYSINGGTLQTLTNIQSGVTSGALVANDVYTFGFFPGVTIGDTLLLAAGVLTTNTNVAAAAPANGAFNSFIISTSAVQISTLGSSGGGGVAPEPGTLALLALGVIGGIVARRRK